MQQSMQALLLTPDAELDAMQPLCVLHLCMHPGLRWVTCCPRSPTGSSCAVVRTSVCGSQPASAVQLAAATVWQAGLGAAAYAAAAAALCVVSNGSYSSQMCASAGLQQQCCSRSVESYWMPIVAGQALRRKRLGLFAYVSATLCGGSVIDTAVARQGLSYNHAVLLHSGTVAAGRGSACLDR